MVAVLPGVALTRASFLRLQSLLMRLDLRRWSGPKIRFQGGHCPAAGGTDRRTRGIRCCCSSWVFLYVLGVLCIAGRRGRAPHTHARHGVVRADMESAPTGVAVEVDARHRPAGLAAAFCSVADMESAPTGVAVGGDACHRPRAGAGLRHYRVAFKANYITAAAPYVPRQACRWR